MTGEKQAGPIRASGYCGEHKRATCPECETEKLRKAGLDVASGADQAVEMDYQLKGEGVGVASITDKPDPKNVRGDWFNPFGSDLTVRRLEAELSENAKINIRLIEVVESSQEEIDRLRNEIALLKLAARCAGDEIRARKPERHGAYWLTFPEYGPSAGMYWAGGLALLFLGACFAWAIK